MQSFIRSGLIRPNYVKYAAIVAAGIFFILLPIILYHSKSAQIQNSRGAGEYTECYTSIKVQPGESLWEISSRYYSVEYKSMKRYIAKIKRLNHMLDENISAGTYLVIPYYAAPGTKSKTLVKRRKDHKVSAWM